MPATALAPVVSILLPARNAAPWLTEAIDSIRAQTETAWELLTIDDCSDDETAELLSRNAAADPRVRVLPSPPRRLRAAGACNLLLEAASAPVIARMDADDVAHRDRLRLQLDALRGEPTLAAVGSRVAPLDECAQAEGMHRYLDWQNSLDGPREIHRDRFVENPVHAPTLMIRTDVLRAELGGWRDQGWPEDWDLFLRACEGGFRFGRVPEVLLRWRLHARQATRVDSRYAAESFLAARAHFLARWLERSVTRPVWVLGAGPVGKRLVRALAAEASEVEGYVDVDPGKVGKTMGRGAAARPVISMQALLAQRPRPFAVCAVGQPGARERIRDWLAGEGWIEERDFVAAA